MGQAAHDGPENGTASQLTDVLDALPPHRIGLVPATEPAEVLPLVGWCPAGFSELTLEVAAVIRSWEDRFGVRLLKIGFAEFSVIATRPPRNLAHAQQLAAEQWAFCDEVSYGLSDVGRISAYSWSRLSGPSGGINRSLSVMSALLAGKTRHRALRFSFMRQIGGE
jgi:hypothetical protein